MAKDPNPLPKLPPSPALPALVVPKLPRRRRKRKPGRPRGTLKVNEDGRAELVPQAPRPDPITTLRRGNALELERAIRRGLRANLRTLRETAESDSSKMYDIVVAKILLEAWEQSDPRRLLLLVQRHKDLVGPDVKACKPAVIPAPSMTGAKPAPAAAVQVTPGGEVADDMTLDELEAMLADSPAGVKAATE